MIPKSSTWAGKHGIPEPHNPKAECEKFCWTNELFLKVFARASCTKELHNKSCYLMVLGRRNPTLEDLWMKNLAQTWYLFGSYRAGRITWSSSKTFQRTTENKDRWKMISYSGIPYLVKKGSVTFSYQLQSELVQHEWQPIWLHIPPNLDSDWNLSSQKISLF